jgi:hypothetical protein
MRSIKARERQSKTATPRESVYQRKLLKKLRAIPYSYFFVKEAKSIRGISDIIGVVNGHPVFLEVKKAKSEIEKYSPRNALQVKFLVDVRKVGAYSSYIYPENEEEILNDLTNLQVMQ